MTTLLSQCNIAEEHQIDALTENFDPRLKQGLLSGSPKTLQDWMALATRFVADSQRSSSQSSKPPQKIFTKPTSVQPQFHKNTPRPPKPCRFCQEKGKELYHWNSDCIYNPKNRPQLPNVKFTSTDQPSHLTPNIENKPNNNDVQTTQLPKN